MKSFLKSFFVFLSRNKLYTAINIFGFAISLVFVILIGLYIQEQSRIDKFHAKGDRTFRMENENYAGFACPIAGNLKDRYPEIEATVRMAGRRATVSYNNSEKTNEYILLADTNFFKAFSFPLIEGTPENVMNTRDQIVVTETFALKIFGTESPVGKVLTVDDNQYTVCGVAKDLVDTHISNPQIIMPFINMTHWWNEDTYTGYGNNSFALYLVGTSADALQQKVPDMLGHLNEISWVYSGGFAKELTLTPMDEVYYSEVSSMMGSNQGSKRDNIVLGVLALLVLLFAVINYINLSVAQAGFRAREAATRRLFGSSRMSLFRNFIIESTIICLFALLIAILLASIIEPYFQEVLNTEVSIYDAFTLLNISIMIVSLAILGALSGVMPATVITAFKPIEVVRGTFRRRTKMVYSKILITFQYCITIVLIGCTTVMILQINHMENSIVGLKTDHLVTMSNPLGDKVWSMRDKFLAIPGVSKVSFSKGIPMMGGNNNSTVIDDKTHSFTVFGADSCFMDMMGIEIISRTGNQDKGAVWLNETAARELELAPDATEFGPANNKWQLAGTVRNFNFESLSVPISESFIQPMPEGDYPWNIILKVSSPEPFAVFDRIMEVGKEISGGEPCEGTFLDEHIQKLYTDQQNMATIIGSLSVIAIIVSTLGLLAMATYFMTQRASEVALRKVFGATNHEVLRMLVMNFLRLVVVAFVVAVPIIWYFMSDWLEGYASRIELSWWIFAMAGIVVFLIAGLTVLWQSLKAANANPVENIHV